MAKYRQPYQNKPWKESLADPGPVVFVDIDGVLADMRKFEYLIEGETSREKDWKAFHLEFGHADPIKAGITTVRRLYYEFDLDLVYTTTRPEQHALRTLRWFEKYKLPMGPVEFRHFVKDGPRPALDIKLRHWWEWQEKNADRNPVLGWIDDDPASLSALRRNGCPSWGLKELNRAGRAHKSLRAALEKGPVPADELAKNREEAYPVWKASESEWKEKRKRWWGEEQMRQRERQARDRTSRTPRR